AATQGRGKMHLSTGLIAGLAWFAAGAASAQSLPTAIESLRAAVATAPGPPDEVAALRTQVDRLDGAVASIPPAQRADYAKSLSAQAEALQAASTSLDGSAK